jgi:hypothetical protein
LDYVFKDRFNTKIQDEKIAILKYFIVENVDIIKLSHLLGFSIEEEKEI